MKRISSFLLLCLAAVTASAYSLSGKVKTDSLEALPYVSIYLEDVHMGTTSDLDGKYKLNDIPEGKHTLIISYVGYETQKLVINLEKDGLRDFVLHEQSITLDDVFVTPTGESLQMFLLGQLVKHKKSLKDRVSSFDRHATERYEHRGNQTMYVLQRYKGLHKSLDMALGLVGMKKIGNSIFSRKNLRVEMTKDSQFAKGKYKHSATKVAYSNPALDKSEKDAWEKKPWELEDNDYDYIYDKSSKIKSRLDKLAKKTPEKVNTVLSYSGAYHENDQVIHVIQYDKDSVHYKIHIVDDVWQIRRFIVLTSTSAKEYECQAVSKNLYLPVSVYDERDFIDIRSLCKEELENLKKEDTSEMSGKKLKQHNEDMELFERLANGTESRRRNSVAYTYKNLKVK